MKAKETLWQYLREGLEMTPPFKGYGMKFVEFSMDHPDLFSEIFLRPLDQWDGYRCFLSDVALADEAVPAIMKSFGLSVSEARTLFEKVFVNCFGMSVLLVGNKNAFTSEEIAQNLGYTCRAYLLAIKSGNDGRIGFIPKIGAKIPGKLSEYIKSPFKERKTIVGLGSDKATVRIFLDEILYFEAVGELVFAYTKEEVYEIKKRLYQIEAEAAESDFMRVSKSVIINLCEVKSLHPGINRCIYAYLSNDEQILISRNYAKEVVGAVKNLWGEK